MNQQESSRQRYFHFTLSPVQGFVAQARRIRDFWAGSFLLSWLSAVAIHNVEKQGGKISFPSYDENYMNWLKGNGKGKCPQQGGIPNRFMAEVPENFDGNEVVKAVQSAWKDLAQKVWKHDLKNQPSPVKTIWEQQIEHFWEMSWVLTENKNDNETAADRRKNWRNHALPVETGFPCSLMEGWVNISAKENYAEVKKFWDNLRSHGGFGRDLNEHEQLCAIAFVKRRFYKVFKDVKDNSYHGWNVSDINIPSINGMAAVHWLERVLRKADNELLKEIETAANELRTNDNKKVENVGSHHPIACIENIRNASKNSLCSEIALFNGEIFFKHALQNTLLYESKSTKRMLDVLDKLKKDGFSSPTPYYAILLMDGDNMGKNLQEGDPKEISAALLKFNQETAKIVKENDGFLIYAGGDDVLALLPVEDALNCAYELSKAYVKIMKESAPSTTLSGAIQFAHVKTPLTLLLKDAHNLLDDVAKKKHGRNSIAIRVWNQGGKNLEWAMPWSKAVNDQGQLIIQQLIENTKTQFSGGFFYKLREIFLKLNLDKSEGDFFASDEWEESLELLLIHAYLSSGKTKGIAFEQTQKNIRDLLSQCKNLKNDEGGIIPLSSSSVINPDGALLVRFLVSKGLDNGELV